MADALTAIVSGGTMPALAFDKFLGVGALTNGINFRRVLDGKTNFSINLRQMSDLLLSSNLMNTISDGTNTFVTMEVPFFQPIILEGNEEDNFLSFTINDNLSGLDLWLPGVGEIPMAEGRHHQAVHPNGGCEAP